LKKMSGWGRQYLDGKSECVKQRSSASIWGHSHLTL
jgi:hypothetical protein